MGMIPAEAVEAAAIAWVGEQVWQDCNEAWRADYLERAQVFLEAAAPHMLGCDDALWHEFQAATAGTNPSETIRQLIRDWTNKHKQRGSSAADYLDN